MDWLITAGIAAVSLVVCYFATKCPYSTSRFIKGIWGLASAASVIVVVLRIQSAGYLLLYGLLAIAAILVGITKQKR